jgi:hypothetical protein
MTAESGRGLSVWKPDEAGVREQIVLTAVYEETDTGQPGHRWIAEDTKRPGCWNGADDFIEAVRGLAEARQAWDEAFGGES